MDESSAESSEAAQPESGPQGRRRSAISFPYLDLETCLGIVKAIHELGGISCEWDQIAAKTKHAPKGGAFRQRMLTSRVFNLIEYSGQNVELTDIGRSCADPQREKDGRVRAFLAVPLFQKIYELFGGEPLPSSSAIESQMAKLGVTQKQTNKARQVFIRSATTAGFFEIDANRLVKPQIGTQEAPLSPNSGNSNDRDGVQPSDSQHPLIKALLAQLPPASEGKFEKGVCLIWLQAMLSSLQLVYQGSREELQEIEVRLREQSAA